MKWISVLGFCGVMVSSAVAGERWPDGPCADVAQLRADFEKNFRNAVTKANARLGLLLLQRNNCGVDITSEVAADKAARQREIDATVASGARLREQRPRPMPEPETRPAARPSMNCTTIKLDDDMSTTNCF